MNNFVNINHYAIQENNAGVECFLTTGNVDVAQDHFRRALASKLDTENRSLMSASEPMGGRLCTDSAEIYEQIDDDATHHRCITPSPVYEQQEEVSISDAQEFVPYLYMRPFKINQLAAKETLNAHHSSLNTILVTSSVPNETEYTSAESTRMSLMIIFNLALAHHAKDKSSMKAYSIYQIAITLLSALSPPTDSESLILHVAILNNYGVWCYENKEFDSMLMCFEELMRIVDDVSFTNDEAVSKLNVAVKRGIFRNLRSLLME